MRLYSSSSEVKAQYSSLNNYNVVTIDIFLNLSFISCDIVVVGSPPGLLQLGPTSTEVTPSFKRDPAPLCGDYELSIIFLSDSFSFNGSYCSG